MIQTFVILLRAGLQNTVRLNQTTVQKRLPTPVLHLYETIELLNYENLLIDSNPPFVEADYLNINVCEFESSLKDEGRMQSADSRKTSSQPRVFHGLLKLKLYMRNLFSSALATLARMGPYALNSIWYLRSTLVYGKHHAHNKLSLLACSGAVLKNVWECMQKTTHFQQHFKLIVKSVFNEISTFITL